MSSSLLESDKITFRHAYIYAFVLTQGGPSRLAVARALLLEVWNPFPFIALDRLEQVLFFLC